MKLRIVELFSSIEGEGRRAGLLATFIRLAGCNLDCSYCDTGYARSFDAGSEMELNGIIERVLSHGNPHVTITGGEPLASPGSLALARALAAHGLEVNVESNGSLPVAPFLKWPGIFVTMDWKCPSSGSCERMLPVNLPLLREGDVLKIVLEENDFDYVEAFLRRNPLRAQICLGPVFGRLEPARLVDFVKGLARLPGIDASRLRVQLQLHKIIWGADATGV